MLQWADNSATPLLRARQDARLAVFPKNRACLSLLFHRKLLFCHPSLSVLADVFAMTDQRAPSTERRPEPEYCDDPEVVNFSRTDAAPRPVTSEIYPQDKIYVASSTQDSPGSSPAITGSGLETSPLNEEKQVVEEKAPSTPWWRRKKIVWIVGIVVFLVLVGLIVGLVVALVVNKKDDESSSRYVAFLSI